MEIVPQGEDLIVEARVNVDSIRHPHLNQFAELRFTTFNSRITPLVAGKINYISADALTDKDGLPYYVIRVQPQTDLGQRGNSGAYIRHGCRGVCPARGS